jgi:hypothetical protein
LVGGDFSAATAADDDTITAGYLLNSCYTADYARKDIVSELRVCFVKPISIIFLAVEEEP